MRRKIIILSLVSVMFIGIVSGIAQAGSIKYIEYTSTDNTVQAYAPQEGIHLPLNFSVQIIVSNFRNENISMSINNNTLHTIPQDEMEILTFSINSNSTLNLSNVSGYVFISLDYSIEEVEEIPSSTLVSPQPEWTPPPDRSKIFTSGDLLNALMSLKIDVVIKSLIFGGIGVVCAYGIKKGSLMISINNIGSYLFIGLSIPAIFIVNCLSGENFFYYLPCLFILYCIAYHIVKVDSVEVCQFDLKGKKMITGSLVPYDADTKIAGQSNRDLWDRIRGRPINLELEGVGLYPDWKHTSRGVLGTGGGEINNKPLLMIDILKEEIKSGETFDKSKSNSVFLRLSHASKWNKPTYLSIEDAYERLAEDYSKTADELLLERKRRKHDSLLFGIRTIAELSREDKEQMLTEMFDYERVAKQIELEKLRERRRIKEEKPTPVSITPKRKKRESLEESTSMEE